MFVWDNLSGMNTNNLLRNKKVYAFGDSIVYGHTAPEKSFMRLIANENHMQLSMYAKNGATVIKGSNDIITQVKEASSAKPDVIVFDGYTNDAYSETFSKLGTMQGRSATTFDNTTFCGAFEEIIYTMKQKWPDIPIIYVTIHKSGGRDWNIQCKLRELAMKICDEWGVEVVDIFNDTALDTRDADPMKRYIIGGAGSHPNETACREFYMPLVIRKLKSVFEEPTVAANMDIYLMIGQSNMAGRGVVEQEHLGMVRNAFLLNSSGLWERAQNVRVSLNPSNQDFGFNRYSTIRKQGSESSSYQGIGPAYSFAIKIGEYYLQSGKAVGLVVNARGGTDINSWSPNSEYYNEAVKRAKAAVAQGGRIRGILWHQGETDVSQGTDLNDYMNILSNIVRSLRNDLNTPDTIFVAGQIRQNQIKDGGIYSTDDFNQKITEVSSYIENSAWVSSEGLTDTGDMLHFNSQSQIILGERYAQKTMELLGRQFKMCSE